MNVVLIYSGGLDSTVLLYHLRNEGHEVRTLTVDYGQRHVREIESAGRIAERLGCEHRLADLRSITSLLGGSSLTSTEVQVPDGHYAEETMKATVVPNRNMIMLSVAAGWAIASKCDAVAFAAHSGDHAIYPDCRSEFADALAAAIRLADWHEVTLIRPFVALTKAEIVKKGAALGVQFADTWSCYKGGALHCGRCGTCIERREAFQLAGVDDPTAYAPTAPGLDELILNNWRLQP
jgi:7-cyano-7-deazaguanine synthase